ncbi:uncharacterized protein LOC135835846 isoform X2 [Planococcus citri]|uniref:uncharacterized protein LOC135835846 isoform X2 n=1 Tax=Planococcus citri TaxID=170843 RepID=UPI0031F8F832
MNYIKFAVFTLCVLYKLEDARSIKCYQCSTAEDPDGEDNCGAYEDFRREKHVAVDCSSDESKSPGSFWDGRWRQVIRQCASVAENGVTDVCHWGVLENGVYWEKCYCSKDGCNSSVKNIVSKSLMFFILNICVSESVQAFLKMRLPSTRVLCDFHSIIRFTKYLTELKPVNTRSS